MICETASLCDAGRVRPNNEDAVGRFEPGCEGVVEGAGALYLVADGMGGHQGGEVASGLAVQMVRDRYFGAGGGVDPGTALVDAFVSANTAIHDRSTSDPALEGMGTTCTAMALRDGAAYFAHVGDSRAYRLRDGELEQISHDHSLVGEMVRSGLISVEDARSHPRRNVITRSLGVRETVELDAPSTPMEVADGDVFLLCSDGLSSLVDDGQIRSALDGVPAADACAHLVRLANDRGGRDNISVVVVRVINAAADPLA